MARGRTISRDGKPNPVDIHVGARVRQRRTLLGLSQERLGEHLGLTFQQVQKYERGANRIGASRLYDLARVLETDLNYFFDEMPEAVAERSPGRLRGLEEAEGDYLHEADPLAKRETLELVRAYYRIRDQEARRRLFELTKALAARDEGQE